MNTHDLAPEKGSERILRDRPGCFDRLARHVIALASDRAPAQLTERLREEWLADLQAQPGPVPRLKHALGCYWAAMHITVDPSVSVAASVGSSIGAQQLLTGVPRRRSAFSPAPALAEPGYEICEINTTPLVDILLVLLVTLIVSLPLLTHAVKIELPQGTPHPAPMTNEVIDLDILFDGSLAWNGNWVANLQQLEGYLRTESLKNPQPEIHLRADRHVKYDVVAKVLAATQRSGVTRVGFANTDQMGN